MAPARDSGSGAASAIHRDPTLADPEWSPTLADPAWSPPSARELATPQTMRAAAAQACPREGSPFLGCSCADLRHAAVSPQTILARGTLADPTWSPSDPAAPQTIRDPDTQPIRRYRLIGGAFEYSRRRGAGWSPWEPADAELRRLPLVDDRGRQILRYRVVGGAFEHSFARESGAWSPWEREPPRARLSRPDPTDAELRRFYVNSAFDVGPLVDDRGRPIFEKPAKRFLRRLRCLLSAPRMAVGLNRATNPAATVRALRRIDKRAARKRIERNRAVQRRAKLEVGTPRWEATSIAIDRRRRELIGLVGAAPLGREGRPPTAAGFVYAWVDAIAAVTKGSIALGIKGWSTPFSATRVLREMFRSLDSTPESEQFLRRPESEQFLRRQEDALRAARRR